MHSIGLLFKQFQSLLVPSELVFQAKILKWSSLITALLCLVGIVINAFLGLWELNAIIVLCSLAALVLYFKMPLTESFDQTATLLILTQLVTISLNWFTNGGMFASTPYYMLLLGVFAAVVLSGVYLWLTMSVCMLTFIILVLLEYHFPLWVTVPDYSFGQKISDLSISVVFIFCFLTIFVNYMLKSYRRQYKRAETANQAKSIFLSQLSHELRTPLNAIIGFSHTIKEKPLSAAKQQLLIERVHSNGMHLLALVNQILDVSSIESGKMHLDLQDVELGQLLKEVSEYASEQAQQKQLSFRLVLPDQTMLQEPLLIFSDPNRLRQILLNLIGNAIKYTTEGEVICQLERRPESIEIQILDSGSGIPAEMSELIFEPFYRLEQHKGTEGLGLGLAISKIIADNLSCKLKLLRSSSEGAVFALTIPYSLAKV